MNKSKHLIIVSMFVMIILLLSACGEKKSEATPDEAKTAETTAVLETTSDGGTVEQDSEGNIITKNSEGKVTKVEDKNGVSIDVTEYLATHTWVENSASSEGGNNKSESDKADHASSNSSTGSSRISGNEKNDSASSLNNEAENDIPVIIATLPDDEDLSKSPDL